MAPKLSIILPLLNESKGKMLKKVLHELSVFKSENPEIELIAVDGGSTDETLKVLKEFEIQIMHCHENSRAKRLNYGILVAKGKLILLHHPRVLVQREGLEFLYRGEHSFAWGCFSHQFLPPHSAIYDLISWYSNKERVDRRGIVYFDHCYILNRENLCSQFDGELPLVPERDIFEDTEYSLKLLKYGMPVRLPFRTLCSNIRFEKNGLVRQLALNQFMKACFHAGVPDQLMNKIYEKGLNLNSIYARK